MKTYRIEQLTYPEIADYLSVKNSVIIPFGTLEAHGKHLPVSTDSLIAQDIAYELSKKLDILVAPTLNYGITNTLFRYPVASTITPSVYKQFVADIITSFSKHGFRRFFLLNGHGGHNTILNELASEISKQPGHRIAAFHWWETVVEVTKDIFGKDAGHAAAGETAIIQAIDENLVRSEQYNTQTEFFVSPGVTVHPAPGSVIYYDNEYAPPNFNIETSKIYKHRVVEYLENIINSIINGWNDLDNFERM